MFPASEPEAGSWPTTYGGEQIKFKHLALATYLLSDQLVQGLPLFEQAEGRQEGALLELDQRSVYIQ